MRSEAEVATPLQRRMGRFAKIVGLVVGATALVAFVRGLALGASVHEMFFVSVALAVSAVPEGLPVGVTITLAVGVHRMARRRAVVIGLGLLLAVAAASSVSG